MVKIRAKHEAKAIRSSRAVRGFVFVDVCIVENKNLNSNSTDCSAILHIIIICLSIFNTFNDSFNISAPPKIKKIEDIACLAGETVRMEIDVEGSPQPSFSITKNGKDVSDESNIKISSTSIGKGSTKVFIEISDVKLSQSGHYSIKATNDLSQTSEYWNCTVKSKPIFVKCLESEYIHGEKETVNMSVRVDAFPEPKLTWYHDNTEIKLTDTKYKMDCDGNTYTLKITGATRVDAGKYSVKAVNEHGSATSETQLLMKCTPELTKKLHNITVQEGESNVELVVGIDAYPRPHTKWFIDGIEIDENRNDCHQSIDGNNYKLVLNDVSVNSQGNYCCKIMNDYGILEDSCSVTVNCEYNNKLIYLTKTFLLQQPGDCFGA